MACASCWCAAFVIPVVGLIVDDEDVYFSYRSYLCAYGFSSDIWLGLKPVITVLFLFIPMCVVITTTVCLLVIARQAPSKSREMKNWQGTITTILTATVYCVSVLPSAIHALPYRKISEKVIGLKPEHYHAHFYRLAASFLTLNTISNFYIYSLTVPSFRQFIWMRMRRSYRFITRKTSSIRRGERAVAIFKTLKQPKFHSILFYFYI